MANGKPDDSIFPVIVLGCIAVLIFAVLFWDYSRIILVYPLFIQSWVEYFILEKVGFLKNTISIQSFEYVNSAIHFKENINALSFSEFVAIIKDSNSYYRFFYIAMALFFVVKATNHDDGFIFNRKMTLTGRMKKKVYYFMGKRINSDFLINILRKTKKLEQKTEYVETGVNFMRYQSKEWKSTLWAVDFDPSDLKTNWGKLNAPQLTPLDWLKENDVYVKPKIIDENGINFIIDEERAKDIFIKQLGRKWSGILNCPIYMQFIAVAAALNVKNDSSFDSFVSTVAEYYALFKIADANKKTSELMAPHLKDKSIVNTINRHGNCFYYENTAILGVYAWGTPFKEWGGKGKIFHTASFRWMKPFNRPLFYGLNNVGRRKFHIEGAGIVSHWNFEYILSISSPSPIFEPKVEQAIEGLKTYLKDQGINDLEDFINRQKNFDFIEDSM